MNIIPLLKMKKRKILSSITEKDISNTMEDDEDLYILDYDGIEKDKPNLCTYQKYSGNYKLWVDYGPRNIGDVVDVFMSGVEKITIRSPLWHKVNISDIREISENKIFINLEYESEKKFSYISDIDGLVNFKSRETIESSFKYGDFLKNYALKNEIYSYENDSKNINYWNKFGVKNLLVDIDKYEDFKKWNQKVK
jgi:hypothetical protein